MLASYHCELTSLLGLIHHASTDSFVLMVLDSYLIASHTTDYQNPMLFLNTLAVMVLVVAKFPNMHKVRIFGINADK